jgi:hypothetical protein
MPCSERESVLPVDDYLMLNVITHGKHTGTRASKLVDEKRELESHHAMRRGGGLKKFTCPETNV